MSNNNMTIDGLGNKINDLTNTVDNLAVIVKNEFDNVNKQFGGMNTQLKELRQGQENIELKLTNVAYRFELQEVEAKLKHLNERVEALEHRSK
jgi:archaellum component FlaC